ncbi:MAG: 2-dehydro-3-deoxygalactonokinase, partial [Cucumibacter sp.]
QGWVEAPYLDLPADLGALGRASVPAPAPGQSFRARIVPGVCRREAGREDVMRGEETQLLGVSVLRPGFAGLVLKAGTHSKWARLEGARLIDFSTAMTGELFEAASAHTVLRHSVGGEVMGPLTEEGIAAGLEAGLERPDLLTTLMFRARAAALVSERGPDWCSGYLSGLLVGAEVAGHRDEIGMGPVPVLGAERLTRLYRAALKRIGVETQPVEATEATLAGLAAVHKQIYATR